MLQNSGDLASSFWTSAPSTFPTLLSPSHTAPVPPHHCSRPTPPAPAGGMPDIFAAAPATGMPDIFADLGDDLELSDDSE